VPTEVHNAQHTWTPPFLNATPMSYNPSVVTGVPVVWSYCALRPPPHPDPGVTYSMAMVNDWGAGYCADITVSTTSAIPLTWDITVPLVTYPFNGVPSGVSNATWSFSDPDLLASGAGWNNTVVAGQPRVLGMCALRPNPPVGPVTTSFAMNNDWGGGYCATITVSTTSTTPINWQPTLALTTAPFNGTPNSVSNVSSWSWSAPNLTIRGIGWDYRLVAGQPRTVGYCANR
jgi:cellulase/cellobiase CelA1